MCINKSSYTNRSLQMVTNQKLFLLDYGNCLGNWHWKQHIGMRWKCCATRSQWFLFSFLVLRTVSYCLCSVEMFFTRNFTGFFRVENKFFTFSSERISHGFDLIKCCFAYRNSPFIRYFAGNFNDRKCVNKVDNIETTSEMCGITMNRTIAALYNVCGLVLHKNL